ncbi:hypothetical protein GQ600_17591 [Phytophthora cactorum]|nr:hypothetical protein GQ600_17591 [Phytophthora cactorum]
MPRAEDQSDSTSDGENSESQSGNSDDGDSSYDSNSDSGSSEGDDSEEGSSEEEQDGEYVDAAAAAKKQRVRADIDEMRRMMGDMDTIKARLQHRLSAERQARIERLAREDREREEQDAALRKADEERQVEVAVQTEPIVSQQQMNVSQQNVGEGTGFPDGAPNKAKPAGLTLYDLVKSPGFGLSLNAPSPVRRADSPEAIRIRSSNERALYFSGSSNSTSTNKIQRFVARSSLNSPRSNPGQSKGKQLLPPSRHYDENSASVSNSLVSSDAGNRSAVSPDLSQQRDHKFNAAALLSTGKHPSPSTTNDNEVDKTDEQREMEAIQFLLFRR